MQILIIDNLILDTTGKREDVNPEESSESAVQKGTLSTASWPH